MKAAAAVVALVLLLPGCGTVLGTALGGPQPFAGTRVDVATLRAPVRTGDPYTSGCHRGLGLSPTAGGKVLTAVDLPVSFAADVALLPVTTCYALAHHAR